MTSRDLIESLRMTTSNYQINGIDICQIAASYIEHYIEDDEHVKVRPNFGDLLK